MEENKNLEQLSFDEFMCLCNVDNFDDIDNFDNIDNEDNGIIKKNKCMSHSLKLIYENIKMYDKNNKLIGLIPMRKRDWYIKKGLCNLINENDIAINFEPKIKSDKMITEMEECVEKKNICVICGSTLNLKKFRVVPYEIKRLFPREFKSHKSSDVVVICSDDSSDCDIINRNFKLELFREYNVDIEKFKINSREKSVYNHLTKIVKNNYEISNHHTRVFITNFFKTYPSNEEIDNFIDKVKNKTYEGFKTPEEMLMSKIIKEDKLHEFVKKWKNNFVNNMNPTHLQWDFWSDVV